MPTPDDPIAGLITAGTSRHRHSGNTGCMQLVYEQCDADEWAIVAEALTATMPNGKLVPEAVVREFLMNRGHHVGSQAIGRHRRGDCQCRV